MFNLLMQYNPWKPGTETLNLDRLFEFTDLALVPTFRQGSVVDFSKLTALPCLFMEEGIGDELARVGQVTRARAVGQAVTFDFTFDLDFPPIKNSLIFANRNRFDMPREREFTRGHWAVKEVDLFREVLRLAQPRRQRPTVFTIPADEKIEPSLVSVMMPFDGSFSRVYQTITDTAAKLDLRCRRADEIWENPTIIQDIASLIDRSRVVICDCTGRNANVFYEAGIAHTLGREVILITQSEMDVPFDLRHHRYIQYLNNAEGVAAMSVQLEKRLRILMGKEEA